MKNLLKFSFLAILCCVSPAVAVPKETGLALQQAPSFTGTWVLDRAASDPMEEMMTAEGLSAIERKMYSRLSEKLEIEQAPAEVVIKTTTSIVTDTQHLVMDGSPQTRDVFRLGSVTSRTNWDPDHKTLVTLTDLTGGDGNPAHGTVRRSIEDKGQTLLQVLTLEVSDHRVISARRIYRRQKAS